MPAEWVGYSLPAYLDWPNCAPKSRNDSQREREIASIVAEMKLQEKIGQMIQPELFQVTPDEAKEFKFGSILNGAGMFPQGNPHASTEDWVSMVDSFWIALDEAYADRPFRIPMMWATDAVHGHNNVFGATIFPHNIGLGCIRDTTLIRAIGQVTAREVAQTAIDWTFAPNVTVPRDYRWGRHYEGYSESPEIVAAYAREMVMGLQGGSGEAIPDGSVIACAKHWIADGGTQFGIDRGIALCSEDILRSIHAAGYFDAIAAGVNSVMVSFSGWHHSANYDHSPELVGDYNGKISGSKYLVNDILKDRLGFDGLVITDWDAHADVSRCDFEEAAFVIEAGVDMLMISQRFAWRGVFQSLIDHVNSGRIPMQRIDDAVTRILRTKMRAGLWDKPRPSQRASACRTNLLGCPSHRMLAKEAVSRSVVLLKNDGKTLPLPRNVKILVTGSAANDIRKQTGGFTLSWQSTELATIDLPGGATLGRAIADVVGVENCVIDAGLDFADPTDFDAIIVAIGEDAYAEMRGNIRPWRTLEYSKLKVSYRRDLDILRRIRSHGQDPKQSVTTVMFSGRPLYITEELNLSDAFVAAWLPGPYIDGLVDIMFEAANDEQQTDFSGRLGFSWPKKKKAFVLNHRPASLPAHVLSDGDDLLDADQEALFPIGYGLTYAGCYGDLGKVPPDDSGESSGRVESASAGMRIMGPGEDVLDWMICGHNLWAAKQIDLDTGTDLLIMHIPSRDDRGEGLDISFKGFPAFLYARFRDRMPKDFRPYLAAKANIVIQLKMLDTAEGPLYFGLHDDFPGQVGLDIRPILPEPNDGWSILTIAFEQLLEIGMELDNVDTPFMLYSEHACRVAIRRIEILIPEVA